MYIYIKGRRLISLLESDTVLVVESAREGFSHAVAIKHADNSKERTVVYNGHSVKECFDVIEEIVDSINQGDVVHVTPMDGEY